MHKECNTRLFSKIIIPMKSVHNIQFFYDPLLIDSKGIYTETEIGRIEDMKCIDYPPILTPEELRRKEWEEAEAYFKSLTNKDEK